jgi:hypothetical protein
MSHDVFISHSKPDKLEAVAVCATLENRRIRCWIAPRDVTPGTEWSHEIIKAITDCRIFVLIFSSHADRSKHVMREVDLAVSKTKIIIPFRIENQRPDMLQFYLNTTHWLDALSPPREAQIEKLADTLSDYLDRFGPRDITRAPTQAPVPSEPAISKENANKIAGLNKLALALYEKNDYSGAEPLFREVLAEHDRLLGPNYIGALTAVTNLANCLRGKQDFASAAPLYCRVWETRKRVLGDHPDTLRAARDFAFCLHASKNYVEAYPLFVETLWGL